MNYLMLWFFYKLLCHFIIKSIKVHYWVKATLLLGKEQYEVGQNIYLK